MRAGDTPLVDGVSLRVSEGESVALLGHSGSGKSLTAAAITGSLSPQLDPRMTVASLVRDPLARLGVPGDHRAIAAEALRSVSLGEEFLRRRPAELSGGQAQRVAIARAIATGARIVLADEPVSGLDRPLRDDVLALFRDISRDRGVGIDFVSHDLEAVGLLCDRSIVLDGGVIVEEGPTGRLLVDPAHEATRTILRARPRLRTGATP